jgi:CDP-diacylglycerol---glycerol-3-phosphate 3-phosphatidyltransferase
MNLPIQITLSRIILTLLIMGFLFVSGPAAKLLCLILFILAAITDWLDGYLARRWNQITPLGMLLDPIADKILVIGIMLAFVQLGLIKGWMLLIIIFRELLITGVRLYALGRNIVIPAAAEGKHKTVSQMFTIFATLCLLYARDFLAKRELKNFDTGMRESVMWMMWVTVILTVISGVSFFYRNRSVLLNAKNS